jgi:Niemann-Pick C1 protein
LNAFSLVNLTICAGLAVEFTAHIVHSFITARGDDSAEGRSERVISALGTMGPAVIHGGVSSLIASAVLAMSGMPIIQAYYFFMFFMMVVVASVNGFILLPVLLSIFGDVPVVSTGKLANDADASKSELEKRERDMVRSDPGFPYGGVTVMTPV